MTISDYAIRRATCEEAPIIREHRRAMFSDMGSGDQQTLDTMGAQFLLWVMPKLASGEYLGWFAIAPDRSIAAGLGLWRMDWPPHIFGGAAGRANIVNVYTQPLHRRRGLARSLMHTALEWCRENGIRAVILHASRDGRALYESLGFQRSNEMRLML